MLKGFEKETAPLSKYEEQVLLPMLVRGLSHKHGKGAAVKNAEICRALTSKGYDVTEPRIRKIINYIRVNSLVPYLLANGTGYYIASDRREILDYIETLRGRENAIREVREALEGQMRIL